MPVHTAGDGSDTQLPHFQKSRFNDRGNESDDDR